MLKVAALYAQIRSIYDGERQLSNVCDLCGSEDRVAIVHQFLKDSNPPCLCLRHRCSWGVSRMKFSPSYGDEHLLFTRWVANMVIKDAKKYATQ